MSLTLEARSEGRCKICRSPNRAKVDQLLLWRAEGRRDPEGLPINIPLIIRRAREWDLHLNQTNIHTHFTKHCSLVEAGALPVVQAQERAADTALELLSQRLLSRDIGPDALADDLIEIAQVSLREQLRNGRVPKITIDQALKAIDVKTRRKHNEKVVELLDLQAEALTQSLGYQADVEDVEEIVG